MGMFKQLKDAKKAMAAAPGIVDQAMQLGEQAQHMAAAQQAAAMQQAQAAAAAQQATTLAGPDAEPIAGVSLEQYARICREMAGSQDPSIAAAHGIAPDAWQAAMDGWAARMQRNPAVAQQFNAIYMGR
jgi:hypothetical protein